MQYQDKHIGFVLRALNIVCYREGTRQSLRRLIMLRCSRWGVRIHQSGVIPRWSAVRTRRWGVRRSSQPRPLCPTPAVGSGRPLSLKRQPLVPRSPRTRRKKRPRTGDSLVSQSKNSTGDSSVLHHNIEQESLVSLY